MNLFRKSTLLVTLMILFSSTGLKAGSSEAMKNKDIVAHAFEQWQQGVGSPFDLLSEHATWTIMGPTASAGIYQREELTEKVLKPFQAKLKTPLKPDVRKIYQEGDTVIILFEASATLKNGDHYQNSYAWFFNMKNGRVDKVTAVLDLHAFDQVMAIKE